MVFEYHKNSTLQRGIDDASEECCTAIIAVHCFPGVTMSDVVDRIFDTYQSRRPLNAERVVASRPKIARYIEILASAGHSDGRQLAEYGLAYLQELQEGRDTRFTGC
jgi:hypothetical protein